MIIARSPLRISLGGGGTDLASYYLEHEGFLTAAAINKYVYVTVMPTFTEGIFLRYSSMERVSFASEIKHPILRESLLLLNQEMSNVEITSFADIPAGTGLGSSSSFTTALIKSLSFYNRKNIINSQLAELACKIEIDILNEPIGKQDQYAAAYGGINSFIFKKDDSVSIENLNLNNQTLHDLEDNLLLFFTGFSRSASDILGDQKTRSEKKDNEMLNNLHYVKDIGLRTRDCILKGDIFLLGELMHEHWENKKKRSSDMTNQKINEWYELAMKNGAIGGKLVGAGGGGFLMFIAKDRNKLRKAMAFAGLEEMRFKFDFEGTKILMSS